MQIQGRNKGIAMVLLGAGLWGSSSTAIQFLFTQKNITPEWLLIVRMLITGLGFMGISFYQKLPMLTVWKEDKVLMLKFCALGLYLMQYPFFKAIALSNSVTATVIQYLMPVILLGFYLHQVKRKPNKQELIAVILAVLGTYLLVTKGSWTTLEISPEGFLWAFVSAFGMAFYTEYARRLLLKYSCVLILGWGSLVCCGLLVVTTRPWNTVFTGILDGPALAALGIILFLGTFAAYYLYLESTIYIPASETGALAAFEPLSAFIMAILVLHISFGWAETLGALCIITMVVVLARSK
jgi:drug/metabolite transporter (DMT)-like permease